MTSQKHLKQYASSPADDIPLLERHDWRTKIRSAWKEFIASVPLPALWITAHIDFATSHCSSAAVHSLKKNLILCRSTDAIANQYRVFLQKFITPLNRKILKSRSADKTFSFRGCLERNTDNANGAELHFHFFLWESSGLFLRDDSRMDETADIFDSLWHSKVNDLHSHRYKPTEITPVCTYADAINVSGYTLKSDTLNDSYELFDDWSSSAKVKCLNRTSVVHRPTLNDWKTLGYAPHQGCRISEQTEQEALRQ